MQCPRCESDDPICHCGTPEFELEEAQAELKRAGERIRELEETLAAAREVITMARNELGVPQPGYPAPVANVCDLLAGWFQKYGETPTCECHGVEADKCPARKPPEGR